MGAFRDFNIKGHDNFPTQMFHNNQQACNDQEKAQLFNNYFYSVFSSDITTPVSESALSASTIVGSRSLWGP